MEGLVQLLTDVGVCKASLGGDLLAAAEVHRQDAGPVDRAGTHRAGLTGTKQRAVCQVEAV